MLNHYTRMAAPRFDRSRANAANAGGYLFSFNPVLTVPPSAVAAIQNGLATATDVLALAQSVQGIPTPPTVAEIQNGLASQAELVIVGEAVAAVLAQVTALPAPPTVDQVQNGLATSAALAALNGVINTVQSVLVNKTITDPATGVMTVYAADGSTVLFRAHVFQDAAGTMPYAGNGAERRERLEAP